MTTAPIIMCPCADARAGEYEAPAAKEASSQLRASAAFTIGTAARSGPSQNAKTLSMSRSIQHGIDWHVPVIVHPRPPPGAQAGPLGGSLHGSSGAASHVAPAATSSPQLADAGWGDQSPRYMQESPPRVATVGRPPMPPPSVARTVRKEARQAPGAWDWNKLVRPGG